ncbi:hypothetical protein [Paraburkholderia sp. GAS32]|uniref:hypothetical protein n=1 Tax=Paraburkholderia sp. GAS32 TaxID=3035129 RepID=UPI003D1979AC
MKKILLTLLLAGLAAHANAGSSPETRVCPDGQNKELAVLTYYLVGTYYVNKFVCSGDVDTEAGVRKLISQVADMSKSNSVTLINLIPLRK